MRCLFLTLGVVTSLAASAGAAPARLTAISPTGAPIGGSIEVTLVGDGVADATALLFSDPKVQATVLAAAEPPKPEKGKPAKGAMNAPKPTEAIRFKVTVPAGLATGLIDVRAVTPDGVSNPRAFALSDRLQVLEVEPNNDVDKPQTIEMNSVVHGVISAPTDVDYYAVAGRKGQRMIVSCLTTSIDSRLPAALQIFDSAGKQLAFNRGYRNDDALCDVALPADGTYLIRVFHFTYTTGGPDHFYRLSVSTAPWIDAVFPPAVAPGTTAKVTVYGRNLPGGRPAPSEVVDGQPLESLEVAVTAPADGVGQLAFPGYVPPLASAMDGFALRLKNAAGSSEPYLLGFASGPITLDCPGNDSAEQAQAVAVPGEAAGRIESRSDRDWYRFSAKKGDVLSIELYGDRIGSAMDTYLQLYNPAGKLLQEIDDNPEVLGPIQFYNRSDDPKRLRFTAPEDGDYRVMVSSREASIQYGPRDQYRLRITPEQPDFRLVTMPLALDEPSTCTLGQGGDHCLAVYAWRLDGFNGPITVNVEGLPPGVTTQAQTLEAGQNLTYVLLTASDKAADWTGAVRVVGKAKIGGRELKRDARPAGVVWPLPQRGNNQTVPAISRLERDLVLAVRPAAPYRIKPDVERLVLPVNGKATFKLAVERRDKAFKDTLQLGFVTGIGNVTLGGAKSPGNNRPATLPLPPDKGTLDVTFEAKNNAPAGLHTVVLEAVSAPPKGAKNNAPPAYSLPVRPITVLVLGKDGLKVDVKPAEANAKPGETARVTVSVARPPGVNVPVKLEVMPEPGTKGLSAKPATLAPGEDLVELEVTVDGTIKPGERLRGVVKASATLEGVKEPLQHEGKFRVNVAK